MPATSPSHPGTLQESTLFPSQEQPSKGTQCLAVGPPPGIHILADFRLREMVGMLSCDHSPDWPSVTISPTSDDSC